MTKNYTVKDTFELDLKDGQRAQIIAYPIYKVYNFEVWEDDLYYDDKIGSGRAYKPNGVAFATEYY